MKSRLIQCATRPVVGTVTPPGSKSYTNRALPIAAVSRGRTKILNPLYSEDTRAMIDALRLLGVGIIEDEDYLEVAGVDCRLPVSAATLNLVNSGTSIRFLAAMVAAAGRGTYILDGNERMRERPIADLIDALNALGVSSKSIHGNGCPPIEITTEGLRGGIVRVRGDVSSQFLSALLMAAPLASAAVQIEIVGELVSKPYVDMTIQMMSQFGVKVDRYAEAAYLIEPQEYFAREEIRIEPDASAASYWFAAAAISGGEVRLPGLGDQSLQGDLAFVDCLKDMGCLIAKHPDATLLEGFNSAHGIPLHGIDVNMRHISDTVPTLAAVAVFADGPTTIRDIANIRVKECDRLAAIATELRKLGVCVEEGSDWLRIIPAPMHGARLATYNDHRMAMSLALIGLKVPGIEIENPDCVAKTYPNFWRDWDKLVS